MALIKVLLLFFTRGRYDPSGGIIVIITIIMSGRSGLVLCGRKCALKSNKIKTLNADGKPLEEKRGFTFITSGERSAFTNLANEIQCRPIVLTQGLDCHWLKDKGARQPCVFQSFAISCLLRRRAPDEARGSMYEAAQLWATVASHARYMYLPCDHGTSVAPSGLLPSDLNRPRGSLVLGTSAFTRARHMMSLMAKWRCDRP